MRAVIPGMTEGTCPFQFLEQGHNVNCLSPPQTVYTKRNLTFGSRTHMVPLVLYCTKMGHLKFVLFKIKVSLASDSSLGIECFSLVYLFGCFPLSTLFHEDVGAILQANLLFLISKLGESDRKSTSSSSSGEDAYETKI